MRICHFTLCLVSSLFGALAAQALQSPVPGPTPAPASTSLAASNPAGPQIQFATPIYEFGRVKAGDPVKHTFVFTNTGNDTLVVSDVHPQCGCTAAGEWTRKVEPGKVGEIPIQFNSANFNGPVFKTVSVSCNDKQRPLVMLQLKGTVWKPIELQPPFSIVNLTADATNGAATVKIINNMDQPLSLEALQPTNKAFSAELKATQPGKEFQLTIHVLPPLNPGSARGSITLKTSATNTPTLEVPFWVHVQPALSIFPPQVMLTQPLPPKSPPAVITVQNNSTNKLTLSEPAINVAGVDIKINETKAGQMFTVQLSFPEGFEIPPGQRVEFTAKSSSPSMPLIKVPVMQIPRPTAIPVPAAMPRPVPRRAPVGGPPPFPGDTTSK